MPRPRGMRKILGNPKAFFFKPQGIPMRKLEIVELSLEEFEAIRLKCKNGLNQTKCAEIMQTSQSTFQRILSSAMGKISDALIDGKAIKIIKK